MLLKNNSFRIIILISILTIVICGYVGYRYLINEFYARTFPIEEYIRSYDEQYSYIQLSSPKKTICTLCIVKKEIVDVRQNLYSSQILQTDIIFDERDILNISWGINSYDLFFESHEGGVFIYKYNDDEWMGRLYLDVERMRNEIDREDISSYWFTGIIKNQKANNLMGLEKISVEILKENIPNDILKSIHDQLY